MGMRTGGILAAVVLVAASAAWAQAPEAQPQVRIFVNGQEVPPGEPVQAAAGAVQISVAAEAGEGQRGAYLGARIGPGDGGVAVMDVFDDSPAAKAGLKAGDVITALDGEDVRDPGALVDQLHQCQPGDRVRLRVRRGDERLVLRVRLGAAEPQPAEREERPPREKPEGEKRPAGGEAILGVMVAPLNDDVRELAGTDEGVLIDSVMDDSPAAKAGLQPGDVITAVGGERVAGPPELLDRIRKCKPGDAVAVTYHRMGKRREAVVRLGERPAGPQWAPGKPPWFEFPEGLGEKVPELREQLERMRPQIEEWAKRWQERGLGPEAEVRPPYDLGKDIGRLTERLDRIEGRLEEMERRLDRLEK